MYRPAHHHRQARQPNKLATLVISFLLVTAGLVAGGFFLFGDKGLPKGRYIVALLGDPVEVAMYDSNRDQWTTLDFSLETHMSGVQGLGDYRIDALWDVAATEASPSAVIMQTLTHELGIPITHYIAHKRSIWQKRSATDHPYFFDIFSVFNIQQAMGNQYDTNIPLGEFVGLSRKRWGVDTDAVTRFLLSSGNGLIKKSAPDGSEYLQFDQNQFDQLTKDAYEDLSIREEGYRVAVYNTTVKAFLGSQAARILSKLGTNVVFVGNENSTIDVCQMIGKSNVLSSYTASVVHSLFDCTAVVTNEDGQADLTIKVGTDYAKKYFITP